MNDFLNTTTTTTNAGYKSPNEAHFGTLPPVNPLAFMQPGFRRVHRTNKSESKAEQCFYLSRGQNHPRDCVKVLTSSGLTSDKRDVTWEVERVHIIGCSGSGGGRHTGGVVRRSARQIRAAEFAGTAGIAGTAGAAGSTGDGNGPGNGAVIVGGATGSVTIAGGNVAVIPAGDR